MFTHPELQHHAVRMLAGRAGFAALSTADFQRLERVDTGPSGWVPYCKDHQSSDLICTTGVDAASLAAQGLHYARLRAATTTIVTVPAAIVPSVDALPLERVYVFCPGRCGSTLLCQLLRAIGVRALAEPGFYLDHFKRAWDRPESEREHWRRSLDRLEYLLLKPFDDAGIVVLKPHPYCAADPELLLARLPRSPKPRTIALLRQVQSWSRSWHTFNQTEVGHDIAFYVRYLEQLERVVQATDCLLVAYEELLATPVPTLARIGAHLGRPVDMDRLVDSLRVDAHTGAASWRPQPSAVDPTREAVLNVLWQLRRPDALIARLGIAAFVG